MSDFTERVRASRDNQLSKQQSEQKHSELVGSMRQASAAIESLKDQELPVTVKNQVKTDDLAKTSDIQEVLQSINALNLTTFLSSKDSWSTLVEDMAALSSEMNNAVEKVRSQGVQQIESSLEAVVKSLDTTLQAIKGIKLEADKQQTAAIEGLTDAVAALDVTPVVNVPEPKVVIRDNPIDLSALEARLAALPSELVKGLTKQLKSLENDGQDIKKLEEIKSVLKDILTRPVPVPEYPTTIKISNSAGQDILDPTAGYAPSDLDEAGNPKYYGFLASDGRWYIMQNNSDTTLRYVAGTSDYSTNWTNRASLSYGYFDGAF